MKGGDTYDTIRDEYYHTWHYDATCDNKDWSRKVVHLAEARDHGVDAYNEYLRAHHSQNGSAAMALRV